jgi:hypothetical protein
MRMLAAICILAAGQLMSLQPKQVVYLPPHKNAIEVRFNGCVLELINSPGVIHLPANPPRPNAKGEEWSIEVKNFGPRPVTITGDKTHFNTVIRVGQTLRIDSNGSEYLLKR